MASRCVVLIHYQGHFKEVTYLTEDLVKAIANFEKFITLTDYPPWIEMAEQLIEELSK